MGLKFRGVIARDYETWFSTPRGKFADRLEKKVITDLVKIKRGDKILDVGCGTGHFSSFFRELGGQVTGIDPAPEMLAEARKHYGGSGIDFITGDAYALPFADCSFDLVTLITVLGFLDQPERAIAEAFRVSRGRVLLAFLNRQSLLAWQRRQRGGEVWSQVRLHTLTEVKRLLGQDKKINWQGTLRLPLVNHGFAEIFRYKLELFVTKLKLPFGAFIVVLAEKKE